VYHTFMLLFTLLFSQIAPANASLHVGGTYIDVYYASGGVWVDSGNGMRVYNGGWNDVTWPGSPWNQITVEYSLSGSAYRYDGNDNYWTYSTTAEADNSVGSTNESYYRMEMSGLRIDKTETWDDAEKGMLITMKVTNTSGSTIEDFRVMHAIDPDQDYNSYGYFDTYNDVRADGLFATSSGYASGLTVGYGVCDPTKQDLGHTSDWQTDADAAFSDFGGSNGDYTMHFRHRETSIDPGATINVEFVFLYDTSVSAASNLYDTLGYDLCEPCGDDDGDGFIDDTCGGDDCDDDNAAVFPGANEVCNGIDDDCDMLIDDADASLDPTTGYTWFADSDSDSFGDPYSTAIQCLPPPGYVSNLDDCDDTSNTIYPGAPEYCNGIDDNCDGLIDESPVVDGTDWYSDSDGDGYGDPDAVLRTCDVPLGYTWDNGDCDDVDPAINPSALEVCDGVDNDCDGLVDDDDLSLDGMTTLRWYQDADGDSFGNPAVFVESCSPPPGYVGDNTDCDDTTATIYPGAPEVPYDGIDQDCDGSDLTDVDGDGYDAEIVGGLDCDDTEATTNPAAVETADGVDEDCDDTLDEGTVWYDDDGDGFTEDGGDCNDANPGINPAMREICDGVDEDCDEVIDNGTPCFDDDGDGYSEVEGDCNDTTVDIGPDASEVYGNGIDDDCDGVVDNYATDVDGDGYTVDGGDCDDADAAQHPGAVEEENGIDDDCDGIIDEGTAAFDDDGDGYSENEGDCNDNEINTSPGSTEIIGNGMDDDCDGAVDEGTNVTDDDGDGFSELSGDCDDTDPSVYPGAEELDNDLDDDCDGEADEGLEDRDLDGFTSAQGDCDDSDGWVFPGAVEMCDGVDNDCDGIVDLGCDEPEATGGTEVPSCGCTSTIGPIQTWFLGLPVLFSLLRRRRA
jgi:hypothetical protein